MLIFYPQRLVILANPKTGTTSLEAALLHKATMIMRGAPLKHTAAQKYDRYLAAYLGDTKRKPFTLVSVMREPIEWLGSWYRYRQRQGVSAANSTAHVSFEEFVQAWCQPNQPEFAKVGSQAHFLAPEGGRAVDRIFRYDHLPAFVAFLEARLSTRIKLPVLNASPAAITPLSDATLALLHETAARDYDLWQNRAE